MKKPFLTLAQAQEIKRTYPTPFHIYDERGIRENARALNAAFAWNPGFKEYFAVKATPTPGILKLLREEGCGVDCSSLTELMMAQRCGFSGSEIMFSSNETPAEEFELADRLGEGYPARMNLPQQGAFQLGYYHQTQDRYQKKEDK